MFRLFPIFYDRAEEGPSGGKLGEREGGATPAGGSSSSSGGSSSGSDSSSSNTDSSNPDYSVSVRTSTKNTDDTRGDLVEGDGNKFTKSKPYEGKPTQGVLGSISQTFGTPPKYTAPRHIHISAGPYYTGKGYANVRIWVNQYVTAQDHSTGAITADSSFDHVISIADITPAGSSAPYWTGTQTQPKNFFGQTVNFAYEQDSVQTGAPVSLAIDTGNVLHVNNQYATNQLYIEYEGQALTYMPFMRKIQVLWSSGFSKNFDILLPGSLHSEFSSGFRHSSQNNLVRTDGCQGDSLSAHVHTSISENYITYNGNMHNFYAYTGFFKEVNSNGSNPFPNGYISNTNWNNYRYYDWSFDSNDGPFNFGQSGNQLPNYVGEQYYKGIIGNVDNQNAIGGLDPVDWIANDFGNIGNAYDYIINKLHLPAWGTLDTVFDGSNGGGFKFSSVHVYSYNTPDCTGVDPAVSFDVCLDPNASDYYYITGVDCSSNNLASYNGVNYISNPQLAIWNQGTCCSECNNLTLTVVTSGGTTNSTSSVSTQNGTDGVIEVTVLDGNGVATGNASYNYVIQGANGEVVGGLGSFNSSTIGSGTTTNTSWTFGYNVALAQSSGANGITAGSTVSQLAGTGSNILVPATTNNGAFTQGLSPGTYTIFVYDQSTNAEGTSLPCFDQVTFTIENTTGIAGCTDNSAGTNFGVALNYNSNAVIDDGSCQYCHASNGTLIDDSGNLIPTSGEIATAIPTAFQITPTLQTNSNDAEVTIINGGISPTGAFQSYINNIINGTGQVNADFTLRLYKAATMNDYDNAIVSTTPNDLTGFTAQAAAYNNNNGGWAYTYNTTSLGANMNYGYYAVKVAISDPDAAVEIEECFQVFYFIIPVQACENPTGGFATAVNSSGSHIIINDPRLWVDTPAICNTINSFCCNVPVLTNSSGPCQINEIEADFYCDPIPSSISFTLEYNDSGTWIPINTNTHNPTSTVYTFTYLQGSAITSNTFVDDGFYRVVLESSYSGTSSSGAAGSANCIKTSSPIRIDSPIYGCTDPLALNFNALATCPDTCTYCIYGCMDPASPNYNSAATCDDGSCTANVYGCTDPAASNYDPNATIDDGSCIYGSYGCTDPTAYNYNQTCNGTSVIATIDDGCCFYPCDSTSQPSPSTYVTTDATGTCASSNSDGTIVVTGYLINTGIMAGQSRTVSYYTNAGVLVYTDPTTYTNTNSSNNYFTSTYTALQAGVYYFTITDNYGCVETTHFSITASASGCGCTDPNAPNYDPNATTDDGSCLYDGCTDPNASNYNPNAAGDDGSCVYPSTVNPCIPENTNSLISLLEACVAKNGFQYYNKLVTGQADDCSIMNVWKIILIEYLVSKRGNLCIYNCADSGTPSVSTINTCDDDWTQGGPVTGVSDQAYAGSSIITGQGTTITDPSLYFVQANELFQGDMIKMPSGNIYRVVIKGSCTYGCYDPETAQGARSGHWEQCVSGLQVTSFNDSVNYLDKFNTFVAKFCVDCDIIDENVIKNVRSKPPSKRGQTSGISIDGISGLEI